VGVASLVKSVLRETMFTEFRGGMGFFGFLIGRRAANNVKGALGISEALNGLGEAAEGNRVIGIAVMEFLS
jgi:hypothetical protein